MALRESEQPRRVDQDGQWEPQWSTAERRYRIVSMFSGCGGLDLGFEGGFEYRGTLYERLPTDIVAAYDNDIKSKQTYDKNFSHALELFDLSKIDVLKAPAADILIGGFPCQEFSSCGPRGGVQTYRGGLFRAMSKYANYHRPMLVVAENVSHLALINKGKDLKTILRSFMLAGYRSVWWPIYAPDYGVPQTRRRVFIIGIRKDIFEKMEPLVPNCVNHRSASWAIDDLKNIFDESVPNQSQYFKAGLAKKGHGQGDEVNQRDAPAYTIRANSRSRVQFHYELPRRLTVRECARIQTFPDSFVFPNEPTPSIRQIGNAVPPVLAYHVAKHLLVFLKSVAQKSVN